MDFKELERLLLSHGFQLVRYGKGSARFYRNESTGRTTKMDYHGSKEVPSGTLSAILKQAGIRKDKS